MPLPIPFSVPAASAESVSIRGASDRASRAWWDADADDYHRTHGEFLGVNSAEGEFVWCPEGLHEGDHHLLGDIVDKDILEVGCGSAPCARWLAGHGARAVGLDISMGMLARGQDAMGAGGPAVPLIQASAELLPFADEEFRHRLFRVRRRPVRCRFAASDERSRPGSPSRRIVGLCRQPSDSMDLPRRSRAERLDRDPPLLRPHPVCRGSMDNGVPTYVEHHRTIGDRVREIVAAGLQVRDIIEPEWPEWLDREWGQWSRPVAANSFRALQFSATVKP